MSNYAPPGYPPAQAVPAYPPTGYPPQRPQSGCGGCLGKFLIFLGIIFLIIIGLCCGGVYYLKSSFTKDSREAQTISEDITSIRVPALLEPVAAGRVRVPLAGTLVAQGVIYSDSDHKSVLILGEFGEALGEKFKDQLLKRLESEQFQREQVATDERDRREELKDQKSSRLERTIRNEKANFEIVEGVGVKSNKHKIRVQGAFLGKSGPAILIIEAYADTLSKEKVEEIIKSIE
jgi:hypothetical protein